MKKVSTSILSMILAAGVLAGCGGEKAAPEKEQTNPPKEAQEAAFPVTIKDGLGKEVVIDKDPERIVSLIPSNTEIAFELDLDKEIVGVNDYDNYPEEVTKIEKIGGMDFNVEKIISLNPDLVLAHASGAHNSKDGLKQLEDAGIDVLVVNDAQNFDEVYESIEMIGQATGKAKEADEIVTDMKEDVAEIEKQAETITEDKMKNVFVEVQPAPEIYTAGNNTFMNEMLDIIHAKNVFTDLKDWPKVTEEAVIEKNPGVIVTTHGYYTEKPIEQVLSRKGWENVSAIKNKEVYDVNADLVSRTGPRLTEGLEQLAEAVYPDVFKK